MAKQKIMNIGPRGLQVLNIDCGITQPPNLRAPYILIIEDPKNPIIV
jgi:hypothetical protein